MYSNTIQGIFNNNGVWCSSTQDIQLALLEYFSNLFSKEQVYLHIWPDFHVIVLPEHLREGLCRLPDEFEIFQVIHDMIA